MKRKKKNQPYELPDNLLTALTEHTRHGYILFTYDDKDNFRVYCNFDSDISGTALQTNACKWLQVMDNIDESIMAQSILGTPPDDSDKK